MYQVSSDPSSIIPHPKLSELASYDGASYFEISVLDTSTLEDIDFYIRVQQKDVPSVEIVTLMLTVSIRCGDEVLTINSEDDISFPVLAPSLMT